MEAGQEVVFDPFRFDLATMQLWRAEREIVLRARAKAVLQYLLTHPGRTIPREEFVQHVWAGTHVSKTALRVCIWEIRQALGEQTAVPQYIETVGRQGYRFVAAIQAGQSVPGSAARHGASSLSHDGHFVGRQHELDHLHGAFAQAQCGRHQLVLVTGDAGIGKTSLVRQFLDQVRAAGPAWIGYGQCSGHTGPGEAYLPILEALGRLGCEPGGERLISVLRRAAPTWLVQLPLLLEAGELEAIQRQVHGASRERMMRELVDALILLTAEGVLILVLEDLHWSGPSTVEWLAYVVRRTDRLRLLVLGTYRPAEVMARQHPLRQIAQELAAHQLCQEIRLNLLAVAEVQTYVAQRFETGSQMMALGAMVHQRTDGNALFMVHMLDYLVQHGLLVRNGEEWVLNDDLARVPRVLPNGLRALIEKQVEGLALEAQQCLAVASVAEGIFTAAEVAAGLQHPEEEVERVCDEMSQEGQFLAAQGLIEWPDGTVTTQYAFRHALYREAVYARLGWGQRARLHRRIGERLEAGYGAQRRELASTLARHFERGRDLWRAVQYLQYALAQALARSAYPEARAHGEQGLALLAALPQTPEGAVRELALRTGLSAALTATHGYTSEMLEQHLQRARALCQGMEATQELVPILVGLTRLSTIRGDRAATEDLISQARQLLDWFDDTAVLVQLHTQLGVAEVFRGAHARAQAHQTQALRLYDPAVHQSLVLTFGLDPAVSTLTVSGWNLWLTGRPEKAWFRVQHAMAYAERLAQPFSLINALFDAVVMRQLRGEYDAAWELTQRLIALAHAQGFALFGTLAVMAQGSVLIQRGDVVHGMAQLTTGLAQHRECGAQALRGYFLSFLAEAHLRCGQVAEGVDVICEALRLSETSFDCFWEAELHRLKGELLIAQDNPRCLDPGSRVEQAVACFQQAIAIAQQQEAKALELRAAISLSRLWQTQGKHDAAHTLLEGIYGWFTEGLDTADLRAAKVLLATLR